MASKDLRKVTDQLGNLLSILIAMILTILLFNIIYLAVRKNQKLEKHGGANTLKEVGNNNGQKHYWARATGHEPPKWVTV